MTNKDLPSFPILVSQHEGDEEMMKLVESKDEKIGVTQGEQTTNGFSPLNLCTTHHEMDLDSSSEIAPEITHDSSQEATGNQQRNAASDALPRFLPSSFSADSASSVPLTVEHPDPQDIAKEAMRLTKQTLLRHQSNEKGDCQVNPRLSMVLPMKLSSCGTSPRLNKFVRRLHDMLSKEKDKGFVEWRRGLLVLKSTGYFAKNILPKYFNTRNFKTFRRQLNYYGFVHIRSFSNAEQSTCALWVNGELSKIASAAGVDPDDVASVLLLRRVEIADQATTNEMRRMRKELAISTIEKDLGVSAKALQLQTLTSLGKTSSPQTVPAICSDHDMSGTVSDGGSEDYTTEKISSLEVESVTYAAPCTQVSSVTESLNASAVVSADNTMDDDGAPIKPPPSNASAANLLLLLSRA